MPRAKGDTPQKKDNKEIIKRQPKQGKVEKKTTKERTVNGTPKGKGLDKVAQQVNRKTKTPTKKKANLHQYYEGEEPRVILDNMIWTVKEELVRDFFKSCGTITDLDLFKNGKGEVSGKAAITFDTVEAANKSLLLDGEQFMGRRLKVSKPLLPSPTLLITKRPVDATEEDFRNAFKACGQINSVYYYFFFELTC
eukprot:TRINITY_DN2132_c0_g1_i2.p1 TRINITY_DN2132_c0_g1~~TRINITY_DN2132_c0_g1_i2.p1  ORF type:complete len:195 (+),score=60.45 TRINITY_DN2132_c0_g1_i2:74-658(+)